MKLALCQIDPIIGDLEYNKKKILDGYKKGIEAGADLVIFPELSLVGYPPLDLVEKKEFRLAVNKTANEIASKTASVGLIFGAITEDDDLIGTDVHNSALLCYEGKIQFIQHKTLIPNYDVFDEMRYFDPSKEVFVHQFKGENLGISICEDIWNDADYWYRRRYTRDPIQELLKKGATILINISASPYSYGKRQARKDMLSTLCRTDKLPLAYTCCVGAQTDLIFDGASMCFDKDGKLVKVGKSFEEDFILFDTEEKYEEIKNCEGSFEEEVFKALVFGLKEYCTKLNFKKVLVGLSGGIDSALVTCIAVEAMGAENVHVLLMPSKYSSEGSVTDSLKLIRNLGILFNNVSIQPVVDETISQLKSALKNIGGLTEENLQARIRGLYLMAYSNNEGHLLLTTGNKSEMAVGYATLYGDMAGGLAVIADVYKTDVYKIANYINREKEIIPNDIITKAPSAELKPNQKDQDTLPPYELLDKILRMYLEENKEFNEIKEIIGDEEVVLKVLRMVDFSEYKRKQAAPALRVSSKAFGYGRRYPIVQGWRK
ncbi:NAD synthase [Ignavibacterium album JCM 16511]|uniref:Glutamine-dependent NAD(+) synthetase n=1 Tax=Ignavibacterium album (strain DSM 19864 / JCM 16511 / NBRC 101810 / Mat9-16) TaxID=945713 RepID=I0AJQ0_IGNAJ|nr:NAD+ synthase [Ignavibacterium album]AFH49207.1 NAD synthase [Ignavibacterium album JCM 16511]